MDVNLVILYTIFMLGLIGYHYDVKPPHKIISSIILKGKLKTIYFINRHVFKYRYIQVVCVFIIIFIFIYSNRLSYFYLLIPFVFTIVTPYISYSKILSKLEWILYLILPILMYFRTENKYLFLYLIFSFLLFFILVIKMKFSIYPKKNIYEFKYNKYTIVLLSFLVYILLSKISIIKSIPIELSLIFVALFFCANIENKISSNKSILSIYKNRAYLVCVKTEKISPLFFNSMEIEKIIDSSLVIVSFLIMVVLYNKMLIDYMIFFIGIILIILFNIDIFLSHYIFKKSIVYENNIVRKIIELFINTTVIQYGLYYIVNKILMEYEGLNIGQLSFNNFGNLFKIINGVLYIILIIVLIIRFKKMFNVNNIKNDNSL